MRSSVYFALFASAPALATPIRVAVEDGSSSGTGSSIVSQLNDDSYYDFTATKVSASDIDSAAELANYDVVILGDSGYNEVDWTAAMANALATWTNAGDGGVLSVGWVDWVTGPGSSILTTIDDLQPIDSYSFHYAFSSNGSVSVSTTSHPVTTGLSGTTLAGGANHVEASPSACDATNCQVLGTISGGSVSSGGTNAIVVGEYGSGRTAYLGHLFMASTGYSNSSLRSGDADRLLEQTVAWIADGIVEDADGDGYTNADDCDDTDSSIYPGATEYCDSVDNDCDGTVDEDDAADAATWYEDADGDSYGNPSSTDVACSQPTGYIGNDSDCDDTSSSVYPGASEYCNGQDDDCDGTVDEDSAVDALKWFADSDSDGYGDPNALDIECNQPSGYVSDSTDCDDTDANTNPGADEYCDGHDDDCDGFTDEDSAVDAVNWYADSDSDGYGDPAVVDVECYRPSGYVADNTDCDDSDVATYPGSIEYCGGGDEDCDGTVDEDDAADAITWYADTDSDGFGDLGATDVECVVPAGYVADSTDCDDTDSDTYPGADEYCDGHDDDCDGDVDEDDAVDVITWYADTDADGEGDPTSSDIDCYQPTGYVENSTDCDDTDVSLNTSDGDGDGYTSCESDCNDTDSTINIDATEIWYDGIDQNCDGWSDYDQDGDGFDSINYNGDDCDDEDESINLDATEIWYDGVDQDCDTLSDYDADYDGQDSESYGGEDCDDSDPNTYTGAPDTPYDGVINDCLNANDYDADGDGVLAEEYGGTDCDDANSEVNPNAEEIWYDGIDQDCDGNDDDQDGDGYPVSEDCDDEDASVFDACDTGSGSDTGNGSDTGDTGLGGGKDESGCACSSTDSSGSATWLIGLLGLLAVRRRSAVTVSEGVSH